MAISENVNDLQKKSFVEVQTGKPARQVFSGGFKIGEYDEMQIVYNSLTDIFTYKLNTVTVGTVTLTYAATNKKDLVSAILT